MIRVYHIPSGIARANRQAKRRFSAARGQKSLHLRQMRGQVFLHGFGFPPCPLPCAPFLFSFSSVFLPLSCRGAVRCRPALPLPFCFSRFLLSPSSRRFPCRKTQEDAADISAGPSAAKRGYNRHAGGKTTQKGNTVKKQTRRKEE